MPLPHGIVPVVQTPFTEDGDVCDADLRALVCDAIDAGAAGLLAPAVASETAWLTRHEREHLVEVVMDAAGGRVPVIVGASTDHVEDSRRLGEMARRAGAAAWLVAVPADLYGRDDELCRFFSALVDGVELPLLIQDLQWAGPGLSIPLVRRLREELATLAGLKIETVPAGPKYTAVKQALGSDFYVCGGWAVPQMIEALDRGVDAMVPEASMVRVYRRIYDAHGAGRREEAVRLFRSLLPVLAFTNQEIAVSVAFFKRLLVRKGVFRSAFMRMPGYDWDAASVRIADELIALYLGLEICGGDATAAR